MPRRALGNNIRDLTNVELNRKINSLFAWYAQFMLLVTFQKEKKLIGNLLKLTPRITALPRLNLTENIVNEVKENEKTIKVFSAQKIVAHIVSQRTKKKIVDLATGWLLYEIALLFQGDKKHKNEVSWKKMEMHLKQTKRNIQNLGNHYSPEVLQKRVQRYARYCEEHDLPKTIEFYTP